MSIFALSILLVINYTLMKLNKGNEFPEALCMCSIVLCSIGILWEVLI